MKHASSLATAVFAMFALDRIAILKYFWPWFALAYLSVYEHRFFVLYALGVIPYSLLKRLEK